MSETGRSIVKAIDHPEYGIRRGGIYVRPNRIFPSGKLFGKNAAAVMHFEPGLEISEEQRRNLVKALQQAHPKVELVTRNIGGKHEVLKINLPTANLIKAVRLSVALRKAFAPRSMDSSRFTPTHMHRPKS